ncbi:uncharacterized protein LOC111294752 [Durio zibethinus]|uniref:Uncharacterized protein LOC111294752 n=1 Tax=Durio zibethinus TaxID=66656 RepID=A0A6P5YUH5_DURZI|nr:uncharacterized protein LOC111294752 [Durio zibethinus]
MQHQSFLAIIWTPLTEGWFKLNTDGSSLENPGKVGVGTIILDRDGRWVSGSARFIGVGSNNLAELWALRDVLLLAKNLNIRNLEIELGATTIVIPMVKNQQMTNHVFQPLVSDCRTLMREFENQYTLHVSGKEIDVRMPLPDPEVGTFVIALAIVRSPLLCFMNLLVLLKTWLLLIQQDMLCIDLFYN